MAKINDGTLKDWKDGDKVTSDLYEADREILRVANNDNHDRITVLEVDKPVQDKRLDDLEYNTTGTVVPMTFKELGMQNITFDEIKLGYVDQAIAKAWKPSLDNLTRGIVEESTATDGQTVINLTNSYTVGGNQITVEIDGVPQDDTSYTETSTTSITLSEALVAGQRVVVTIGKVDPNADARFSSLTTQLADLTTNVKSWKTTANTWDDALNSAINYLRTKVTDSRGGTIRFPSGTYDLSPFTLPMRIGIEGDGIGITVLRLKAGSTGNFITVNSQSLFSSIRKLTIDGNKTNCPSGLANLYFTSYSDTTTTHDWSEVVDKTKETTDTYTYNAFENIFSANAKGNGIEIYKCYWGTTFKNIFTNRCDGHGIYSAVTDIFFDTIQTEGSGLCGIYEAGSNNRWSNVKTIWNGKTDTTNSAGMKVTGSRNLINNLEAQDNYCDGLVFDHSTNNQAYGVLVDGNGRVPNVIDPTDGSMVGNLNSVGVRVKCCTNIRVKGIAANYKAPSCYLQNKAYSVEEDTITETYNIEMDILEKNQYASSQSITVPKDNYYSDLFLFKNTTPTWDSNGLVISPSTVYYFDKYVMKEQGIFETIVNISTLNSFSTIISEPIVSPFNQFYVQTNGTTIDFSMSYLKPDGTIGAQLATVNVGTFPLNTDVYISGVWYKKVSDNSKGVVCLNVRFNGKTYTASAWINSLKSFITPKPFIGINHGSASRMWTGTLKFLQFSDVIPNPNIILSSVYTVTKQPYNYSSGLFYDFQNYKTKTTNKVINYTDLTGDTALPTAVSYYRGMLLYIQGGTGVADGNYQCMKSATDTYSWKQLIIG